MRTTSTSSTSSDSRGVGQLGHCVGVAPAEAVPEVVQGHGLGGDARGPVHERVCQGLRRLLPHPAVPVVLEHRGQRLDDHGDVRHGRGRR
jgi:hypothetical protein